MRIIVEIEDGMLTGVYVDRPEGVSVELCDMDNYNAGDESAAQMYEELQALIADGKVVNKW